MITIYNKDGFFKFLEWSFLILTAFIVIFFFISLTKVVSTGNTGSSGYRVGAICEDGWRSSSTGSGTCSSHGGVDYWLYRGTTPSTYEEHLLIADTYPILLVFTLIDIIIYYIKKSLMKSN